MDVAGSPALSTDPREPASPRIGQEVHREYLWLSLTLLLALALRLVRLGTWPYWHDEVLCLIKAEHFTDVLHGVYESNHPPLIVLLMLIWRAVGLGESEWTMKMLPCLLGVLGVATLFLLGRKLYGPRAGLCAAFLLAISPIHVLHSQDLKEYILLPATAPISVYCLWLALETNRRRHWLAYGLAAALACYSEYFAGPMLVAINLWAIGCLWKQPNRTVGWLAGNLLGVILLIPTLFVLLQKVDSTLINPNKFWIPPPSFMGVLFYLKAIAFGYSDREPHFKIALVLYCALAAAGFCVGWKRNRAASLLLIFWFVIPVGAVYVVSLFVNSCFLIRAMFPYALAFYLLAGVALAAPKRQSLRAAGILVCASLMAFSLYDRYTVRYAPLDFPHRPGIHPPRDYKKAAQFILQQWQEGDYVVHASAATWVPFYWYGFRYCPHQQFVATDWEFIQIINDGNPRNQDDPELDGLFPVMLQPLLEGKNRVWYVFSEWERKYIADSNAVWIWYWLDKHYAEVAHHYFRGIELFLYEKERDGERIEEIARTMDDGVRSRVTYRGGWNTTYDKTAPDYALIAKPLEERRGPLSLQFTDTVAEPVQSFTADENPRTVSFAIENSSNRDVPCRVEFLASDALVEASSLHALDPESDHWRVRNMYVPERTPEQYRIPIATATLGKGEESKMVGAVALPQAHYNTYVHFLGSPLDRPHQRADIRLVVAGVDIAANLPREREDLFRWNWFSGADVTVTDPATAAPICLSATSHPDFTRSWADVGEIAFVEQEHAYIPPSTEPLPQWPGDVVIAPRETRVWTVKINPGLNRADVWAYERTEDGKALRIFRIFE